MKKIAKSKLLTSILVPTTTLCVAAGATGLILGLTKNNKENPTFLDGKTVTFSAGEGKIVSGSNATTVEGGTTMDKVDQPEVKANNPKKIFAGWKEETGGIIDGNRPIRKNTHLTAVYNNANSSEYATVLFANDPAAPGPVIKGNHRISVNKGYFFFQVNRPTATWTVEKEVGGVKVKKTKFFKGWKNSTTGVKVKENDRITSDMTLYPMFTEAVTITWQPDGKKAKGIDGTGVISRGQQTTTLETGITFSNFNQPAVQVVDTKGAVVKEAYFEGWYKDKDCTDPWLYNDVITEDAVAYANWTKTPKPGDQYGLVNFEDPRGTLEDGTTTLPSGMTFTWTPSAMIAIKLKDKTWETTNKPSIICYKSGVITYDYKISSWEIYSETLSDWVPLENETVLTEKTNKVRPVLTYAVDSIEVYGETTAQLEKSYQYKVRVNGGASGDNTPVTWRLVKDNSGADQPFPEALAEINDAGLVEVKSVSRTLWEQEKLNCFYVKAISSLNKSATSYLKVSLEMPYVGNDYVWIHTEKESNPKWYYAKADEFRNLKTKSKITTISYADGTTPKDFDTTTDFEETIVFGTELGAIPDGFMADWTSFKGYVDLANSSVSIIGGDFMANCVNYNHEISLNKIITIGPNFLKGCTSYNSPITFDSHAPLQYIQESFLHGCTSFNSTITLPQEKALWIDNAFLFGCTSYNKKLVLPNIISYIGDSFMSQCNAFTSEIDTRVQMVDETTGEPKFVVSRNSLSSTDVNADIYQVGFTVSGTEATAFKAKYKSIADGEHYRTINAEPWTGDVTEAEFKAAKQTLQTTYNLTMDVNQGARTIGNFKVVDNSTNATGWKTMKITAGSDSAFVKHNATNANWEDLFDANGDWISTYMTDSRISGWLAELQTKLLSLPDEKTQWTLDTTNKWWTYGTEQDRSRATIKFKNATKQIDFVKFETYDSSSSSWKTQYTFGISNIKTTTITDEPQSYKHLNTTTYDATNKKFTGTDNEKLSSTSTAAGFIMSLAGYTSALPKAFELSTTVGGQASKAIQQVKRIKANDSDDNLSVKTDSFTGKQYVVLPDDIASTDHLLITTKGGETTGAMTFTATETTVAASVTVAQDQTTMPEGGQASLYFDQEKTKSMSWDHAYDICNTAAQSFYLYISQPSTHTVTVDNDASKWTMNGEETAFSKSGSKITCAAVSGTENLYKITIAAGTTTSNVSINIKFHSDPKTVQISSSSSISGHTLGTAASIKYYSDAELKTEIESQTVDGKQVFKTAQTHPKTAESYVFYVKATVDSVTSGKQLRLNITSSKLIIGTEEKSLESLIGAGVSAEIKGSPSDTSCTYWIAVSTEILVKDACSFILVFEEVNK